MKRVQFDDVMRELDESGRIDAGMSGGFMAARRHRPYVKIILSNQPSGTTTDGFGTKLINVNNSTPHLQQVILDHLTELVSGLIEGRYSMKCIGNDDFLVAELDDSLVDCTPNEKGQDSRFNIINEFVPPTFMEELAKRLMATYEVDVSIVEGQHTGLLLRPAKRKE